MHKGIFLSFEGLDGAGKTTQMDLLSQWLTAHDISSVRTREPGGTSLGIQIRQLLLHHPELKMAPLAEAFLFQADRAQHFAEVILPALNAGMMVITDRCFDSSIAYQQVDSELIEQISAVAMQGRLPDLTILLDLPPDLVPLRKNVAALEITRFDQESLAFHERVRKAFLAQARKYPERIKIIDATQSAEHIHQQILSLLDPLFGA